MDAISRLDAIDGIHTVDGIHFLADGIDGIATPTYYYCTPVRNVKHY